MTVGLEKHKELDEGFLDSLSGGSAAGGSGFKDADAIQVLCEEETDIPDSTDASASSSSGNGEAKAGASAGVGWSDTHESGGVTTTVSFGAAVMAEAEAGPLGARAGVGAVAGVEVEYDFGKGVSLTETMKGEATAGVGIGIFNNSLAGGGYAQASVSVGINQAYQGDLGNGYTLNQNAGVEAGFLADAGATMTIGAEGVAGGYDASAGAYYKAEVGLGVESDLGGAGGSVGVIAPGSVSAGMNASAGFSDGALEFGLSNEISAAIGGVSWDVNISIQLLDKEVPRASAGEIAAALEELTLWKQDFEYQMTQTYETALEEQNQYIDTAISDVDNKILEHQNTIDQLEGDKEKLEAAAGAFSAYAAYYRAVGYESFAQQLDTYVAQYNDKIGTIDNDLERNYRDLQVQTELKALNEALKTEFGNEIAQLDNAENARDQHEWQLEVLLGTQDNYRVPLEAAQLEQKYHEEKLAFAERILGFLESGQLSAEQFSSAYKAQDAAVDAYEKAVEEAEKANPEKGEFADLLAGAEGKTPQQLLDEDPDLKARIEELDKQNELTRWERSAEDGEIRRNLLVMKDHGPVTMAVGFEGLAGFDNDGYIADGSRFGIAPPAVTQDVLYLGRVAGEASVDLSNRDALIKFLNNEIKAQTEEIEKLDARIPELQEAYDKHVNQPQMWGAYEQPSLAQQIADQRQWLANLDGASYIDQMTDSRETAVEVREQLADAKKDVVSAEGEAMAMGYLISRLDAVSSTMTLEEVDKEINHAVEDIEDKIEQTRADFREILEKYKSDFNEDRNTLEEGGSFEASDIPQEDRAKYVDALLYTMYSHSKDMLVKDQLPEGARALVNQELTLKSMGDAWDTLKERAEHNIEVQTIKYEQALEKYNDELTFFTQKIANLESQLEQSTASLREGAESYNAQLTANPETAAYAITPELCASFAAGAEIPTPPDGNATKYLNAVKVLAFSMELIGLDQLPNNLAGPIQNIEEQIAIEQQKVDDFIAERTGEGRPDTTSPIEMVAFDARFFADAYKSSLNDYQRSVDEVERLDDLLRDTLKEDPMLRGQMLIMEQYDRIDDLQKEQAKLAATYHPDEVPASIKEDYQVKIKAVNLFLEQHQEHWGEIQKDLNDGLEEHKDVLTYRVAQHDYLQQMVTKSGMFSTIAGWFS